MQWIYISPHLDDVALSCGGLVWEQTNAGDHVAVWTIFAGDPPPGPLSPFAQSLHKRWEIDRDVISERRREDVTSCERLGAAYRHFDIPDCIYRLAQRSQNHTDSPTEHLYPSEGSLFASIHPHDETLIEFLYDLLIDNLPNECEILCPLGLGNHVDHQIIVAAVRRTKRQIWYYADFPYALKSSEEIATQLNAGWEKFSFHISQNGRTAWEDSIAAHRSQISTFWTDLSAMKIELGSYLGQNDGIVLWKSA